MNQLQRKLLHIHIFFSKFTYSQQNIPVSIYQRNSRCFRLASLLLFFMEFLALHSTTVFLSPSDCDVNKYSSSIFTPRYRAG